MPKGLSPKKWMMRGLTVCAWMRDAANPGILPPYLEIADDLALYEAKTFSDARFSRVYLHGGTS